jgi:pilus assembly protein TadC
LTPLSALVAGALIGLGLLLVVRGLAPPRPTLTDVLADVHRPRWVTDQAPSSMWRRQVQAATTAIADAGLGERFGFDQDLAVTGKTRERLALERLMLAATFVVLPLTLAMVVALTGPRAPIGLAALVSVAGGCLGFVLPSVLLRQQAAESRREFRWAISGFVDLVTIQLAGGEGVETAVRVAAETGAGRPFRVVAEALSRAHRRGESAWVALGELGRELGVPELGELSSSVTLAGDSGARVRQTLSTKAATMREHELAEELALSEAQSERLGAPVVLMLLGFVMLIGYPALARILSA